MRGAAAPTAMLALVAMPALLALIIAGTAQTAAQDWPSRPVTMMVPFAAGGPVDVLGRILAQYLGEVIGKQVIVDNVPGGGMSGSLRVAQAGPDGHLFVLGSIGTHALNQTLSKKPLYNAAADFAPVALIADVGLVLIARKDLPAGTLAGNCPGSYLGNPLDERGAGMSQAADDSADESVRWRKSSRGSLGDGGLHAPCGDGRREGADYLAEGTDC